MFWRIVCAAGTVAMLAIGGCALQSERATISTSSYEQAPSAEIAPYQARFGRQRPLVAVVGHNDGSELTDFVVPYGVLAASGSVDLVVVATGPGPIEMFPALTFEADRTIEQFDLAYPRGADYVIVPAVHDPSDPVLVDWIAEQQNRGATIVGVCDGVLVLAEAGVLDGRRATAHWYSFGKLERNHPQTEWVRDQRFVVDGKVVTTTGVSASIPVSMALVEAIAGEDRADELAESLGIEEWNAEHDSDAFGLTAGHILTAVGNLAAFWQRESVAVQVEPGVDEITLAIAADLWSRTYRSKVFAWNEASTSVVTRGGLRLVPDGAKRADDPDRRIAPAGAARVGSAIDMTIDNIAEAYGESTAAFVALQIEHLWPGG